MDSSETDVVPQPSRSTFVALVGIAGTIVSSIDLVKSWLSLYMMSLYGTPEKESMGVTLAHNVFAFIVTNLIAYLVVGITFQIVLLITSIGVLQRRRWARLPAIVLLSLMLTVVGFSLVVQKYERGSGDSVFVFFVGVMILLGYIIYRFQSDPIKREFDQATNPPHRSSGTLLIVIVGAVAIIVTLFLLGRLYFAPPSGFVGRFDAHNEAEAVQNGCWVGRYRLASPRAQFPDGDTIDTVYAWVSSKPAAMLPHPPRSSDNPSPVFVLHGEASDLRRASSFPSWWYSTFMDPESLLEHVDGTPGFGLTVVQPPDTLYMRITRRTFEPGSFDDNASDSIDVALVKTF